MRSSVGFLVMAALAWEWAGVADARPMLYYDHASRSIRLTNDTAAPLAAFYVQSLSEQAFTMQASDFAALPGATFDPGDLPWAFAYLNFPVGSYVVGQVVVPGSPACDILFGYYTSLLAPPVVDVLACPFVPEPTTGAATLIAAGAYCAFARRKRRG